MNFLRSSFISAIALISLQLSAMVQQEVVPTLKLGSFKNNTPYTIELRSNDVHQSLIKELAPAKSFTVGKSTTIPINKFVPSPIIMKSYGRKQWSYGVSIWNKDNKKEVGFFSIKIDPQVSAGQVSIETIMFFLPEPDRQIQVASFLDDLPLEENINAIDIIMDGVLENDGNTPFIKSTFNFYGASR